MRNAKEKYSIWDLIVIFFLAPFIFIGRIDFDGYSLSELKQENYIIKYRQRRFAFILGILVFILTIYLLTHTRI